MGRERWYVKLQSDITGYIRSPLPTITQNAVCKSLLHNTVFCVMTIYHSPHLYGWLPLCCQLQWCCLSCGNSSKSGVPPRYSANWSGFHRACTWKLALGGHTQTHNQGHEAQSLSTGGGLKFPAQHQGLKKYGKEYAPYALLRLKVNQHRGIHKIPIHHRTQTHPTLAQTLYTRHVKLRVPRGPYGSHLCSHEGHTRQTTEVIS